MEKSLVEGGGSTIINFNPVISNSIGDMSATAVQTEEPKGQIIKMKIDRVNFTPGLSEFEIINDATLIIQNWLDSGLFQTSFIRDFLVKNIIHNFIIMKKSC